MILSVQHLLFYILKSMDYTFKQKSCRTVLLQHTIPTVPNDLIELLEKFDGETMDSGPSFLPNGVQLMDIDSVLQIYQCQVSSPDKFIGNIEELVQEGVMEYPSGPVKAVFHYSKRVPFAQMEGHMVWYLDMDPAPGGHFGQVVKEEAEFIELGVIANSLTDLFKIYLIDLSKGIFHVDSYGQITSKDEWPRNP